MNGAKANKVGSTPTLPLLPSKEGERKRGKTMNTNAITFYIKPSDFRTVRLVYGTGNWDVYLEVLGQFKGVANGQDLVITESLFYDLISQIDEFLLDKFGGFARFEFG